MQQPPILHRLLVAGVFLLFAATAAEAATFPLTEDVVGEIIHHRVQPDDNLYALARKYDVGIVEILAANPHIDAWLPEEETILNIPRAHILPPGPRGGIVINLAELRLFYYPGDHTVITFPIGIGQDGWQTPSGTASIVNKMPDPVWIPPVSIRAENPDLPERIEAGPENPLGNYALYLSWPRFLIHGTNRPAGVGKRSSHGCIRLYSEDIAQLYEMVPVGTPVTIIDVPYKFGWKKGVLYLEVTPTQRQSDDIAAYEIPAPVDISSVYIQAEIITGLLEIDRPLIHQIVERHDGLPVPVAALAAEQ